MMTRRGLLLLTLCFVISASACSRGAERSATDQITVSAASDLIPAFTELGREFTSATGIEVRFNFGSTGQLAQQIAHGAPADLFAAANIAFIEELEREGLIVEETKATYARGRLALWTRSDSRLEPGSIRDLAREEVRRVSIANPEHAPYGAAAREALESAGILEVVRPKLIYGENVRQALQFAETGNADAALIALSLSIESGGRWALIPEEMHRPLDQALAVIKGAKNEAAARRFAAFVNSPEGRRVMRRYGFLLPGEERES